MSCFVSSRNCQYLLHYHPNGLPLPIYNHNLDKILRCDEKCDPESLLPQPFPLFQEERAHINSQMNSTIVTYGQCLKAVGIISSLEATSLNLTTGTSSSQPGGRMRPSLESNLTSAVWANSSDVKWSTCASLKTFVRCQNLFNEKKIDEIHFCEFSPGTAHLLHTLALGRKRPRLC